MPADRPLVIVNPVAGDGRAASVGARISDLSASSLAADVRWTEGPGHASEIAAEAVAEGRRRVIAVGGDGTLQEVVNGLLQAPRGSTVLGIMPAGRGNDLARSIGLPRPRTAAWHMAFSGPPGPVDALIATAGDGRSRWFVSAGGAGFDAEVARVMAARPRRGRLGYLATTLTELWRYENRSIRLRIDDRPLVERRALVVAVANGAYYGGGMKIAPGARVSDGLIDVCIVGDLGRAEAIRWIPRLYRGTHLANRRVELVRSACVRLEADEPTSVHLDGEPFADLPVTFEVDRGALQIAGAPAAGAAQGASAGSER